jgi:hypothetical protein
MMLEGDDGQPFSGAAEQLFELGHCETLSEIESSVEQFKRLALPEMERQLAQAAQERQIARQKKRAAGGATARSQSR